MAGSQEALDRFERQTAWPMMALALAIIPLLVVPPTGTPRRARSRSPR
jgi:hypothetical protein